MKSLWFRLLSASVAGFISLAAPVGHASAQAGANAATGFPDRAEVSYRGNFSMTVSSTSTNNRAFRTPDRRLSGEMDITLDIVGPKVTAMIGGTGLNPLGLNGTIENGYCRLHSNAVDITIVYEGQCSPQGFTGRTTGGSRAGAFNQDGQFDLSAVRLVDLGEQDRLAAAEQAERDRQAAADRAARDRQAAADQAERNRQAVAAQAQRQQQAAAAQVAYRALPNAGPVLTRQLDGYIRTDAQGWAVYKFDAGSLHNVKIVEGSVKSGNYVMKGDYTFRDFFNVDQNGWVEVAIRGNRFNCIEFWDTGGCRGLRTPLQGSNGVASGSAPSGTSDRDGLSDEQRANLQQSLIQSHAPVNQPGD